MSYLRHHLLLSRGFIGRAIACVATVAVAAATVPGSPTDALAQQYPPGIDWLELSAPHFRVIYPRELHDEAQRVAATLERIYEPVSATMEVRPARIPVILNNRSVASNGYVTLGPRRTVWESTPFFPGVQSLLGSGEWYDLLAIHEYRHVAQYARINRGLSRLARIGFGELGLAASAGALPAWFWEGDAVGIETAHTRAGRGRIPAFDMHYRAMLLDGRVYSYAKSRHRSFRDFVPGHYPYGYLMTTHVRRKYGADAWSEIAASAGGWAWLPFAFPLAVKRQTGRGLHRLHRETMAELDLLWRTQREGLEYTAATRKNVGPKKRWTNYAHPAYLADGSIVSVESGLRVAADLVILTPDGRKRRLGAVDPAMYFGGFDARAGFVVWAQERRHPRYGSLTYSVLMRRDIDGGERALTNRTRLFVPAISPDGKSVAAVEFSRSRQSSLVILDANSGEVILRTPAPGGAFMSEVTWARSGNGVVCVLQDAEGKSVVEFGLDSYGWRWLSQPTTDNVWGVADADSVVLLVSDRTGIDNVYALRRSDGSLRQVTSRPLGAYFPAVSPDGRRLAFSDYTIGGFDVVEMDLRAGDWTAADAVPTRRVDYAGPLVEQEAGESGHAPAVSTPGKVASEVPYPASNYVGLRDALTYHSWFPAYDGRAASLLLVSNNLLNTLSTQVGAVYDGRERTLLGVASATYSGLLPVITLSAQHGGRAESVVIGPDEERSYAWTETGGTARVTVPLVFSRGVRQTSLSVSALGSWFSVTDREYVPFLDHGNGHLASVGASIALSRSFAGAYSDFSSPRSAGIVLAAQTTTGRSDFSSRKYYARGSVARRLFGRQDRIRVAGEVELERPENYRYSSILRYARGYDYRYADDLYRATAEYTFPLAYPDLGIGNWLYIRRIIGNVFYDHTIADRRESSFSTSGTFRSAGAELVTEFYLFSLPIPFRFGVRGVYRLDPRDYVVEPFLVAADLW